jgi:regulator of telomere elongation helicase 1
LVGKSSRICPYFYTREYSAQADLILLPYNYLLDRSTRDTLKIDLKDSIIIFDEAHNLEKVASDAASCSFSSSEIAMCIEELKNVIKSLEDSKQLNNVSVEKSEQKSMNISSDLKDRPTTRHVVALLRSLFILESKLDEVKLSSTTTPGKPPSCSFPGAWMLDILQEGCGFQLCNVCMHV